MYIECVLCNFEWMLLDFNPLVKQYSLFKQDNLEIHVFEKIYIFENKQRAYRSNEIRYVTGKHIRYEGIHNTLDMKAYTTLSDTFAHIDVSIEIMKCKSFLIETT